MDIQSLLDSIPAPTEAEMLERRNLARKYTMVLLRDGPASRDDEERNVRIHTAHLQHLTKLQISGKLVINGPVTEEGHGIQGFSLYTVELDEARGLAEADPKVKEGYLIVEAIPWMGVACTAAINDAMEQN